GTDSSAGPLPPRGGAGGDGVVLGPGRRRHAVERIEVLRARGRRDAVVGVVHGASSRAFPSGPFDGRPGRRGSAAAGSGRPQPSIRRCGPGRALCRGRSAVSTGNGTQYGMLTGTNPCTQEPAWVSIHRVSTAMTKNITAAAPRQYQEYRVSVSASSYSPRSRLCPARTANTIPSTPKIQLAQHRKVSACRMSAMVELLAPPPA